ncbi:tail fiber domain-containing protein [Mucilaginibacter phyllosphaerae]|uniref:Tail fiber domain-containing protein n=1 Tax=Mucilaginibacter phyllosphaerae TaxID=1812349 RepID=A0A4Y8ADA3_9SPHI|nr:tail fiber domain-containing protein [Mucilaginibacter phyllosphaerae]MBB3969161.1 hypothetical protein [Mucilaginibacter phyllosphaerae]TEW66029.1 tail fiber domain-containing protein [Mucilaginibacter phyllosphaerae]GGH06706.1 hypothetical protein GCM10007352_11040 [Mucilaginibacter phyllosphaerae]
MIKSKADLKALFKKNSVPTEADFADLIESGLNQSDDGIRKGPGDPLSVVAGGETQELFSFFNSVDAKKPSWKINQNPSKNAKTGFNIYNDTRDTCLFIDEKTGNTGIGSTTPGVKLDVVGAVHIGSEDDAGFNQQGLYLNWNRTGRAGESNFINHKGQGVGGFSFHNSDGTTISDALLYIQGNGNVAVGAGKNTDYKLDVNGTVNVSGALTSKGITLVDTGVIKMIGATDVAVDSNDMGLYSTLEGRYVRLVTNNAPILFFTEKLGTQISGNITAMAIARDGNVSIGAGITPATKLHVNGAVKISKDSNANYYTKGEGAYIGFDGAGFKETNFVNNGGGKTSFSFQKCDDEKITGTLLNIQSNGIVSIGAPEIANARLDVSGNIRVSGDVTSDYKDYSKVQGAYLSWNSSSGNGETDFINNFGGAPAWGGGFVFKETGPNSSMAELAMITRSRGLEINKIAVKTELQVKGAVVTGSDIRIKKDITTTDSIKNLEVLSKLNITEYRHIDPGTFGNSLRKGLIAQEVETVFPEAVVTRTEFLPGILAAPKQISETNGVVTFTMVDPHNLADNDIVKIQTLRGSVPKLIKLIDETTFSVEGTAAEYEGDVMVYGKQTYDFKMVEYDRLYLLNLSATQQLVKENAELKAKNAALEALLAGFEQRLTALERSTN